MQEPGQGECWLSSAGLMKSVNCKRNRTRMTICKEAVISSLHDLALKGSAKRIYNRDMQRTPLFFKQSAMEERQLPFR